MSVDVIVPFAGNCPHRKRALDWTTQAHQAAGRNVIVGHGNAERWCKADAVRDALDRSEADILVIADCDVWCEDLQPAIDAVGDGWAKPHWNVCRLNEKGTTDFLNGARDNLGVVERHVGAKGGGVVVISRETYEKIPLDPRFIGWGGEDQSWGYALQTLLGSPPKLRKAPLYHLWHPPAARRSRSRGSMENQMLLARYFDVHNAGDVDGMRALIGESFGNRGLLHHSSNDHLAGSRDG